MRSARLGFAALGVTSVGQGLISVAQRTGASLSGGSALKRVWHIGEGGGEVAGAAEGSVSPEDRGYSRRLQG